MRATCYRRGRWTALLCAAVLPAVLSLAGCQTAGMQSAPIDEAQSWGVAPTDTYRTKDMIAPTPDSVAGATVVTTDACVFRSKPITDSGATRSPIPAQADH